MLFHMFLLYMLYYLCMEYSSKRVFDKYNISKCVVSQKVYYSTKTIIIILISAHAYVNVCVLFEYLGVGSGRFDNTMALPVIEFYL